MAKIVLIKTAIERSFVGDITAIHESNVELGPAYDLFDVISIPEYTGTQVSNLIDSQKKTVRMIYRTTVAANEWSNIEPESERAWNDNGTWRFARRKPKYRVNLLLSEQDKIDLQDPGVSGAAKAAIINTATDNIARESENQDPV